MMGHAKTRLVGRLAKVEVYRAKTGQWENVKVIDSWLDRQIERVRKWLLSM